MNDNEPPLHPSSHPAQNLYAEADNALYPQAVALVRLHRQASISWLQRQLCIGFNTASRLIERMEKEGVVSAPRPEAS